MPLISSKNVYLSYENTSVVEDLNFTVEKGDYLCIVGENGSGKSTLIKSILGLIKPQSGEIVFDDGLKAGKIGYLPQHETAQNDFPASVKEVVMSAFAGKTLLPIYSKTMRQTALKNLELLGVADLCDRPFRELSGGQQQRVLLARALCATESMLLLDEPVNGLDPNAANEMYEVLKRLNEQGLTVVMITHDIKTATENASNILHLNTDGYFFGPTAEYLSSGFGDSLMNGGHK